MTSFLWGWLAVTVFLASGTSGNNPDSWKCNQPDSFVVQISDTQAAIIRNAEWLVVPNSNEITIQPIPQGAAFDIQANISLEFQGDMTIQSLVEDQLGEDGLGYVMESDQEISWTNNDLVMGILDVQDDGDSMIRRCRLFTFARSCSCPAAVAVEIRQRAEACLELYLCGNANQVLYNQFTDLEAAELDDPLAASVFDENEVLTDNSLENFGSSPINYDEINLNEVVDFALQQAIAVLQQSGKQSIPVSDVKKDFHIGGFIKGHFEATGGTFRDLTSLKRTSNVILSSDGKKYAAACGFGLGEAKVHFDHYKLKLATAIEGFITAQITGVALELKISVDYNQKPCVAQLEHVKITEFGTTNIEISGLGGLGQLLSKLMNWVTDHWRGPIAKVIEENLKNAAHQQLAKLQCEQYRPTRKE